VVPDSPISLQHQQYPGWPTSNGVMDLMARTLVEREIIEGYKVSVFNLIFVCGNFFCF